MRLHEKIKYRLRQKTYGKKLGKRLGKIDLKNPLKDVIDVLNNPSQGSNKSRSRHKNRRR